MSARRIDVRRVSPDDYRGRWRNALDRIAAMERELKAAAYDPALLLAVQAVIAACDALTIRYRGERAASERHEDAAEVLSRVTGVRGLDEAKKRLARVLREKAGIEYSGEPLKPREAEALADHARRFVEFVGKHLPEMR